ncbi:RNA helicase [Lichenicola cladoniae]|uniref:RNA helicase n=1 Tax=Lichenicola cladoniae TaxID=1484109 RepID=A0A6M8HRY5_9PROT|nr:helicase-related protein [Lichenicola cladoniae]NPD65726.1 RNA helicase [Acetobacteraceae bacterium]QKE91253.1 RNA helicase [Lichenicola cladoniae]
MTIFSPAEAAIEAAGLAVETQEMPRLVRLVARRLPADPEAVSAALCEVRAKGWASRLVDLSQRDGQIWVLRVDAAEAASRIADPAADELALREALDRVVLARLRTLAADPARALDVAIEELFEAGGRVLSASQHAELAQAVARAFGLPADAPFVAVAVAQEDQRRRERRAAEGAARTGRREELQRLREWERSLVEFREIPALLGCTIKEVLRWVAAGHLPVARRIPGKGGERWEFDPVELARLRPEVAEWRRADDAGAPLEIGVPPGRKNRSGNAAIARVAALDRYAAHFSTARALDRQITLVTGPTNSGKSHLALDRLSDAPSGMALAPLRLLAHEFREALAARGVVASLATGEERIVEPGSRHLAATVEMCPLHNPVEVAIIDEAQMLYDPDRGAAWTAAIMGAPARHVFVLGAPDCVPMVRRIAALCGDPLDEISLERKGPLVAASEAVALGSLQAGDAVIAFSRRDVLDMRATLQAAGRRVAVVYGALSPEVRRAEAARFNSGQADILVATDAIGMGLNLNIRRVVFAALRKFDGTQSRDLLPQEIKQIGGRAGRYGRHESGVVAVLAGAGSPSFVRNMLAAPWVEPPDLRPIVQPDSDIVRAVAAEIGSDSLFGVLARIRRAVLRRDDPNYRLADMSQAFAVATALEGVAGLDLQQRWAYAMCPVDERDSGIPRLAGWAAEHGAGRTVAPPSVSRLPPPDRASHEELDRAEKRHKRLVAWRWLALRFPEAYPEHEEAEALTDRLNDWIEAVLRQQHRAVATRKSKQVQR